MKRITPEDFLWADVALQAKAKIEKLKTAPIKRGEGNSSARNHISEGRIAKLQLTKDLVRVKQEMNGPEPTQLTQVAKAMVLCGLPYRQTKERTIERRSRQADGSLITVTFQAMLSSVPLPYGSDRNLFHWATDRSIKSGTPFVPWDTATEFLTDMQQTDGGRNYARLRESYRRIAGLSITVERTTGNQRQRRMPDSHPTLFSTMHGTEEESSANQDRVRLEEVHTRLLAAYGEPPSREVWDPLTQLIYSLCSSRTKTPESHAVLRSLRERYDGWPTGSESSSEVRWELLRDAPVTEIEETIQMATFADRKAPQLKSTLEQITARTGALSLAFLAQYRTEKIRSWLEQFPGIGSQVSAAVVNFSSLRRAVISVDGHHQRASIRLGFAPDGGTPRQVEMALMKIAPEGWKAVTMDEHHQLVKMLGQRVCTPQQPLCSRCPLLSLCPTGLSRMKT